MSTALIVAMVAAVVAGGAVFYLAIRGEFRKE